MNEEFIKLAKDDLDVSLLAYQSSKYSNAVFLIQQANEKVMKAILILSDISDYESLKKSSHDAVKPILRFIKESLAEGQENLDNIKKNHGVDESAILGSTGMEHFKTFTESTAYFEKIKAMDWGKIGDEDMLELIRTLEELINEEIAFQFTGNMVMEFPNIMSTQIPLLKLVPKEEKKLHDVFSDQQKTILFTEMINGMTKLMLGMAKPYMISSFLNLMLYPHFNDSRYPALNKSKHNTYDENHPIIKYYMKLYDLTKCSVEEMDTFIKCHTALGDEIGALLAKLFPDSDNS